MNIRFKGIEKNFDIGDIVVVDDPNYLLDNEYYSLEKGEHVVWSKPYRIFDCDIELEDEFEVLYTLQDIKTGTCCGVRFNDWEIRKSE